MAKPFDVHRYVETLRSAGVPDVQADALAQALTAALIESAGSGFLRKRDLLRIKGEIDNVKFDVRVLAWAMGVAFAGVTVLIAKSFF